MFLENRVERPNGVESFGYEAIRQWAHTFENKERLFENAAIIPTGIGGSIAQFGSNGIEARPPQVYGDGQRVPYYLDLQEALGTVPNTIFLVASAFNAEDLVSLLAIAGEYKRTDEVKQVIAVLTAIPHERQDHRFHDVENRMIMQPTTLRIIAQMLAGTRRHDGKRLIDGGMGFGLHSLQIIRHLNRLGFPMLPFDVNGYMLEEAHLKNVINPMLFIADKGRDEVGQRMASELSEKLEIECPYARCKKVRDRTGTGDATMEFVDPAMAEYIKQNQSTAIIVEDEVREGTTSAGIRRLVAGKAGQFVFIATKVINAFCHSRNMTAAELLSTDIVEVVGGEEVVMSFQRGEQFYFSDAVAPLNSLDPLKDRLTMVPLRPEIDRLVDYLTHSPVPIKGEWLSPESTGCKTFLDLSVKGWQLEDRKD